MRRALQTTKEVAFATLAAFTQDRVATMAAALAYYTFFSIAPMVLIAIAIAGAIFGDDAARGALSEEMAGLVGQQAAHTIEELVKSASGKRSGVLATLGGAIAILFGATGVFAELQDALNTVWKAPPVQRSAVTSFFRSRFRSFTVVLGVGFLLLVSLLVSVALSTVCGWVGECTEGISRTVEGLISFGITTVLFALIFKLLPDVKVEWNEVWHGAAITAVMFTLGKWALGFVLGKTTFLSTYGTAASIAALLLWVHYSSMILLIGAELSHEISVRAGVGTNAATSSA